MQVQLKLQDRIAETCVVYEGQTAEDVAEELTQKYKLKEQTKAKIIEQIQTQLNTLPQNPH